MWALPFWSICERGFLQLVCIPALTPSDWPYSSFLASVLGLGTQDIICKHTLFTSPNGLYFLSVHGLSVLELQPPIGRTLFTKSLNKIRGLLFLISISSVQSLSGVWLFETPWIAARQASQSITNSWSLLKTHSRTLAWKIPWTEEPGRLQSMGSLGVDPKWSR